MQRSGKPRTRSTVSGKPQFTYDLANVEEQAAERYKVLIEQMSQREETSEKLKEENQMEWVRRMNNLENRAAEIVKAELIYTFERR